MSYLRGSSDPDSREIFGDHQQVLKWRRLSTSVNFTNFRADQVQLHASDMNFTQCTEAAFIYFLVIIQFIQVITMAHLNGSNGGYCTIAFIYGDIRHTFLQT